MTPYQIQLLLHYYYSSAADTVMRTDLYVETMAAFVSVGLLTPRCPDPVGPDNALYSPTERLRAYVKALMAMPLPEQHWMLPTKRTAECLSEFLA